MADVESDSCRISNSRRMPLNHWNAKKRLHESKSCGRPAAGRYVGILSPSVPLSRNNTPPRETRGGDVLKAEDLGILQNFIEEQSLNDSLWFRFHTGNHLKCSRTPPVPIQTRKRIQSRFFRLSSQLFELDALRKTSVKRILFLKHILHHIEIFFNLGLWKEYDTGE